MKTWCWLAAAALTFPAIARAQPELRWGGDAEGGAPFVSTDPADGARLVGFEVDVADVIARGLQRRARFVQTGFTTLEAAVRRGDFDIGLSGIEDLPARRSRLALTIPYYEFEETLTVRHADAARFRSLDDLSGRRVATLGATLAYDVLRDAERRLGVVPVVYEDDVHPYEDLVAGRVDAVVLDHVIAARAVRRNTGLVNQSGALAIGHYVGMLAPDATVLRDRVDEILRAAMRDGTLEAIFRRYGLWSERVERLYAVQGDRSATERVSQQRAVDTVPPALALRAAGPSLLRAVAITMVLSCVAMVLAVIVGATIATGRVYGPPMLGRLLTVYVEVIRGTPLLLQLFVIYFGLASIVQLPAFVAALLGLGLNYAAYESEIYRSALFSVPGGQLEAARTLGLSTLQTLRLVRAPQAFRVALAPMTNDFIALLKDSSLVSVITVVELTKQASILAADLGSWLLPGVICAGLYLALSLPLARLARHLEQRWRRV